MQNIKAVILKNENPAIGERIWARNVKTGKWANDFLYKLSHTDEPIQAIFIDESAEVKDNTYVFCRHYPLMGVVLIPDASALLHKWYPVIATYPKYKDVPLPSPSFMAEFAAKNGIGEIVCEMETLDPNLWLCGCKQYNDSTLPVCKMCGGLRSEVELYATSNDCTFTTYATIDGCIDLKWKDDKDQFNNLQSAAINAGKIFNAEDDLKSKESEDEILNKGGCPECNGNTVTIGQREHCCDCDWNNGWTYFTTEEESNEPASSSLEEIAKEYAENVVRKDIDASARIWLIKQVISHYVAGAAQSDRDNWREKYEDLLEQSRLNGMAQYKLGYDERANELAKILEFVWKYATPNMVRPNTFFIDGRMCRLIDVIEKFNQGEKPERSVATDAQ